MIIFNDIFVIRGLLSDMLIVCWHIWLHCWNQKILFCVMIVLDFKSLDYQQCCVMLCCV